MNTPTGYLTPDGRTLPLRLVEILVHNANTVNKDLNNIVLTPRSGVQCLWECLECGISFRRTAGQVFKAKQPCPCCSGRQLFPGVNDLTTMRPDLVSSWADFRDSSEFTVNSDTKVQWLCGDCGDTYDCRVRNVAIRGQGHKKCAERFTGSHNRSLAARRNPMVEHPSWQLIKHEWHSNDIAPESLSARSHRPVIWQCQQCQQLWTATPDARLGRGTGCPGCAQESRLEEEFHAALKEQYRGEVIRRCRQIVDSEGKRLELDFLLPGINIAFEIQDVATHSRDSDVEEQRAFRRAGETLFKKGPSYHENKRRLAMEQLGVTVIETWEGDDFHAVIVEALSTVVDG